MGWWSATVMGGDTPLDYQGDMVDLCGVDYDKFADMDYDHTKIRSEIESNLDKLVEYCNSVKYGEPEIAWQVLGVIILESGSKLPDDIKTKIVEAADNDDWAQEDEERNRYMKAFKYAVENYNGTPTEIEYEGLFQKIFEKMSGE